MEARGRAPTDGAGIRIPAPVLQVVENTTSFRAQQCQKMGKGRTFFDVVAFKGTFDLGGGALPPSAEVSDVVLSDEYHDAEDASRSSLSRPGDLIVGKPTTDVIVTGRARARLERPSNEWECSVEVRRGTASLLHARMVASGPRRFEHRALRGWTLSDPEPTVEVPIRYELAYGGWYPHPRPTDDEPFVVEPANPSGRGFFDKASLDTQRSYDGPQWQLHGSSAPGINSGAPLAGFGPVARLWSARTAFGGTYDAAWFARFHEDAAQGLAPDYPADFDMRFFQCAHPALIAPTQLRPGDAFRLLGLTVSGELVFELPRQAPVIEVGNRRTGWSAEPLSLDLVHIDLDAEKVHLTWRTSLASGRGVVAVFATMEGTPS